MFVNVAVAVAVVIVPSFFVIRGGSAVVVIIVMIVIATDDPHSADHHRGNPPSAGKHGVQTVWQFHDRFPFSVISTDKKGRFRRSQPRRVAALSSVQFAGQFGDDSRRIDQTFNFPEHIADLMRIGSSHVHNVF
jgi:hypothetical protein